MSSFEHSGTKIILTEQGEFTASINGKLVRTPSLDSMKKRIDGANAFQPFPAIVNSRGGKFEEATVTGIAKPRGKKSWSNGPQFIIQGGKQHSVVYSPDSLSAIREWERIVEENKRLDDERRKLADDAWQAVVRIEAKNFK